MQFEPPSPTIVPSRILLITAAIVAALIAVIAHLQRKSGVKLQVRPHR
jgi:hypothetical protein